MPFYESRQTVLHKISVNCNNSELLHAHRVLTTAPQQASYNEVTQSKDGIAPAAAVNYKQTNSNFTDLLTENFSNLHLNRSIHDKEVVAYSVPLLQYLTQVM